MKYDQFGQSFCDEKELCEMLYTNPDLDLSLFLVDDVEKFNQAVKFNYAEFEELQPYIPSTSKSVEEFDQNNQSDWLMPQKYKELDIAEWILSQCKTDSELQRAGEELILYHERGLFPLLCFLKFLVDKLREENIVWGVGRGSSVSSFVLYLIGVHRINSLYYDLDPREFLK